VCIELNLGQVCVERHGKIWTVETPEVSKQLWIVLMTHDISWSLMMISFMTPHCVFLSSLAPGHQAVQKLAIWIPEGSGGHFAVCLPGEASDIPDLSQTGLWQA
jgi:hypothetical protein